MTPSTLRAPLELNFLELSSGHHGHDGREENRPKKLLAPSLLGAKDIEDGECGSLEAASLANNLVCVLERAEFVEIRETIWTIATSINHMD